VVATPDDDPYFLPEVSTMPDLLAELNRWRIKSARGSGKARLSLQDLSTATGVARSSLSNYLSGATLIPCDVLDSLVLAMGAGPVESRLWAQAWERATSAELARSGAPAAGRGRPAQLPAGTRDFVGRAIELARLDEQLFAEHDGPALALLVGQGGSGKTMLALNWARRTAEHFPDGQLYVDLRGFHQGPPMSPEHALAVLLEGLGVKSIATPSGTDARATLLRTMLAGKRMLLLLDNARDSAQVRPLLPAGQTCLTLVTSRERLSGLVRREGASRIQIGALPKPEAFELLERVLATEVPHCADAEELVSLTAGLPLALRIAAERLIDRPQLTLAGLVKQLGDAARRLDILSSGDDPVAAIRPVLLTSYQALAPATQRVFRLLPAHPGADVSVAAVAAMAGLTGSAAEKELDRLVDVHLLQRDDFDRYRCHDLVTDFARERLLAGEPETSRSAAVQRCLDWYQKMIIDVVLAINPLAAHEPHWRAGVFSAGDPASAFAWCQEERANILAVLRYGARNGFARWVCQTAIALCGLYSVTKYAHDWIVTAELALPSATGPADRARLISGLGNAHLDLGNNDAAARCFTEVLALRADQPDTRSRGITLNSLAIALRRQGRFGDASQSLHQAIQLHQQAGDLLNEAVALNNLGNVCRDLGNPGQALAHLARALGIYENLGNPRRRSITLVSLGETHQAMGDHRQAIELFQQSHDVAAGCGDTWQAATALAQMGYAFAQGADPASARRCWAQALPAFAERNDPRAGELRTRLALPD
jgi:tetratricopeptide (TPR) repeat protein